MSAMFVDLCRCDKGIVSLVQGFYKEIVTLLNDGWNVSANSLASSMMISPSSTSFWALSIFSSMLSMVSAWNKTLVCGQSANFGQKIPDSQPVAKHRLSVLINTGANQGILAVNKWWWETISRHWTPIKQSPNQQMV